MKTKPKAKRLDWKKIWCDFEDWMAEEEDKARAKKCSKCGAKPLSRSIDWEEQQEAIECIVEANR